MELISSFYAGTFESGKNEPVPTEQNYTFDTPFPEGSNVIVIPMIQTRNGGNSPGLRIWNITETGFKYHLDEVRGSDMVLADENGVVTTYKTMEPKGNPFHKAETVAFIAFVC